MPLKYFRALRAFQAVNSELSQTPSLVLWSRTSKDTVAGKNMGESKLISQLKECGLDCGTVARTREAAYMPWAMERRRPNAFAVSTLRWIGLKSPETAA